MKREVLPEGFVRCKRCHKILSLIYFNPGCLKKRRVKICKSCAKIKRKFEYNKVKETIDGQKHLIILRLLSKARFRAKRDNLPYNLDYKWIQDNLFEFCPVLGLKFILNSNKCCENSPTVDKITPENGYIKENCKIISNRANRLKNNCTIGEIDLIIKYMQRYEPHNAN